MPYLTPDMIAAAQGNFTPAQPPPPNASMSSMPLDPNAGMAAPLQGGASYDPGMGGQSQAPLVTPQAMNPEPVDMGPSPDEVAAARGLFTPVDANMSQAEPNMSLEEHAAAQQTPNMLNGWQGGMPSPMQGTAPPIVQPPRAASQGGGGGNSLAQAVKKAQQGVLGNYDTQAGAVRAEGEAQAAKSEGTSALMTAQLDHQDKLDAISREQVLNAQTKNAEYLQGTQNLIDEVASQKIDPNHFFNTGDQKRDLAVGIGALIIGAAGVWAGQGTGKNPGLDVINGLINKDIETQERNIANKRTAIQARQSMYGQLREQAGDKLLADDKFRLASLEAAKNRIIAFGAGADSKIDRARTEIAVNQVTGEQKKLWLSITERSKTLADAAAAAGAASQAHRAQQQFENTLKVRELQVKEQEAANKANGGKPAGATDFDKQRAEYADRLQKADLPATMAQIERTKAALPKPGEPIPGLGFGANLKSSLASIRGVDKTTSDSVVLSKEELVNRKHIDALFSNYVKALTGAGMSEAEADRHARTFYGARTAGELWDTIAGLDDTLNAQKANLEAGYGPEVVQSYNENMKGTSRPPLKTFTPGLK